MTKTQPDFLNRFTTIPFLVDLLTRKQLTLINPAFWEDYNDRITMEVFQKKKNAQSVYALCLTDERETIHHWNTFAAGPGGCCIEFKTGSLTRSLNKVKGLTHGKIDYLKINDLAKVKYEVEKLPYLKREPFKPENEYRIVALSDLGQKPTLDIPLELNSIRRITISNKLPATVFQSLKESLRKIAPEYKGQISHSTLLNNIRWVNHFSKA